MSGLNRNLRGQASLEALIMLAVGIAALAISLSMLAAISNAFTVQRDRADSDLAVQKISLAVDQVCAMGQPNARTVSGLPKSFTLSYGPDSGNLELASGKSISKSPIKCAPVGADGEFVGQVLVKNIGGAVSISPA